MPPVVYLSVAFLATGSEPWRIPELEGLPDLRVPNRTERAGFYPYERDPETLARPWAVPGTPGLEHRIGGLEKLDVLGTISYDPDNHHRMQLLRAEKVARIARDIPPLDVFGPPEGELLILGWASTYGAIRSAVERLQERGRKVAHAHLRTLNPFPTHTGDVARADKDGFLTIVARKKDMIISGGFNVFPREIEDVISAHPAVGAVAVIGVPEERWG